MANDNPPQDDLNAQMQRGAEQMREQTRNAIDGYFGFLRQSMASIPSGGTDLGEKLKASAEKSIADTHQFLTEVSEAEDFGELMSLQSEIMQARKSRNSPSACKASGKHMPNQRTVYSWGYH